LLAALTGIALTIFGVQFEPLMAQYLLLKLMGLAVICSVSLMLSTIMTPSAATTMSFVLIFGSGMISKALVMAYESGQTSMQPVFKLLNALLPQVGLFDLGSRTANTNWGPVPTWVVGTLAVYMVLYCSAMLSLSWFKFRNQAV
jgi:hypothetical protein